MASRNNRVPIVWAAAALSALLPAMGHARPTHTEGRNEFPAPRATQAASVCDNDGSDLRENFMGSESVPHGPKNRGGIDTGLFGALLLAN